MLPRLSGIEGAVAELQLKRPGTLNALTDEDVRALPTRLDEAAEDAVQALEVFRRDGAAEGELRLLQSHGEVLTALGRRTEAADAWRRYLALATGPEHVQEINTPDNDTDGRTTIHRIEAKLTALGG